MINLSKSSFSIHEYNLLSKNLNFCPNPGKFQRNNLHKDIEQFTRQIKIKAHFNNTNNKAITKPNENTEQIFYKKRRNPTWEPKKNHHTVETFCEKVTKEIVESPPKATKTKQNLKQQEKEALTNLMSRDDIIITNADKGGAVVIQDVSSYIEEANRQLNNTTNYKRIDQDLTKRHENLVNNTLEDLKNRNLISEKQTNALKSAESRCPKFYLQPKIHKKGNPGRPVISSINCHTERISEFVDHHLQPRVKELPSYVQDTTDFINKTKDLHIPENSILVTMDVSSLYTNIPNKEGIEAVEKILNRNKKPTIATTVITTLLYLILTLNNFVFNNRFYLQIKGCAMGTKCAPSYANLFMGIFEENHIYNRIKNKSLLYLRYIDDIFIIWTASLKELETFTKEINSIHHSIKFEVQHSTKEINFLDTTAYIKDKKLLTKLYRKPTDRQLYLHNTSYHPPSNKQSIPFSQAIRIKRICSEISELNIALKKLHSSFISRGYSSNNITQQINKAKETSREATLTYKQKSTTDQPIPFITTYNKTLPNIKEILEKNWNILQTNADLSSTFEKQPRVVYRRNKNLRDFIGQTTISNNKVVRRTNQQNKPGKCTQCYSRNDCQCCKQVVPTTTFKSTTTKEVFKIRHQTNCKSTYAIYLMECKRCKVQYIGKCESTFNVRLNNHRKDALHPTNSTIPASKHFSNQSHNFNRDAKFIIIETITDKSKTKEEKQQILLRRENFWIKKLKTLIPNGLNHELNKL